MLTRPFWRTLATVTTVALLAVSACTADEDPPQTDDATEGHDEAVSQVTVSLENGEVSIDPVVATGPVDVSFENGLSAPVGLVFGRLHEDAEEKEVRAALEEGPQAVVGVASVAGGVAPTLPDEVATTTIAFPEGHYFVAAFESGDNFEPAFFDVEDGGKERKEPKATFMIQTDEFNFKIAGNIPTTEATVLVQNAGAQSHEVVITQDLGGRQQTVAELLAPAPFGGKMWTKITLEPGSYKLACYIPDPRTGKPHNKLGMVRKIEIAPAI